MPAGAPRTDGGAGFPARRARTFLPGHILLVIVLLATSRSFAAAEHPLVDALELRPRALLPNLASKLATDGAEVTIAYIGGSITAADGWRPMTTEHFRKAYPKVKFTEVDAAIGGTGSDLGVFRFRDDVLAHKPDLVFIEFAVNDGGAAVEQVHRCMEGMVRQARAADPTIDILFVYTLTAGMVGDLQKGKFPRAASAMEAVADRYGIPSIHFGVEVARLVSEGKLVMQAESTKTDAERAALAGKMVFSGDGVHPHKETGHRLYLEAIQRALPKLLPPDARPSPHAMPEPLRADHYQAARMVPLTAATLSSGIAKADPAAHPFARWFAKFMPDLYKAEPGQTLTFRFKGTAVGFYDVLGPDCGALEVSVDGGAPRKVLRIDAYCTYHRMGSFFPARDLPDGEHVVSVKVSGEAIDKAAILARNGNAIDRPERFAARNWYVAKVMLVGEPLPPR